LESPHGNNVRLSLKLFRSDMSGYALKYDGIHLKWTAGDGSVYEQDVAMPAARVLTRVEANEESILARIPAQDGQYSLDATAMLMNSAAKPIAVKVEASNTSKLQAIPAQRVIRTHSAVRGANNILNPNTIAILDASPSKPDGELKYQWRQTSGDNLKLRADLMVKDRVGIRFYKPGAYCFQLTVSDGKTTSAPVDVLVLVDDDSAAQIGAQITVRRNRPVLFVLTAVVLILGGLIALILRRFVRVHLSTLLALLLVMAAGLLLNAWENLTLASVSAGAETQWCVAASPGWPWPMMGGLQLTSQPAGLSALQALDWRGVGLDAGILLAALVLVGVALEWLFGGRRTKSTTKGTKMTKELHSKTLLGADRK